MGTCKTYTTIVVDMVIAKYDMYYLSLMWVDDGLDTCYLYDTVWLDICVEWLMPLSLCLCVWWELALFSDTLPLLLSFNYYLRRGNDDN